MDREQLASFLRTRRERLAPQHAGVGSGTRRRTPGLRREEVALLAHISTEYYVRLEQARAPRPSGEVLTGISRALQLTDAESEHLHVLAGTAPTVVRLHPREVRPSILALLDRLPQTAALVVSAACEVLASNTLAAALTEDHGALAPADRNLARRTFLGAGTPLYGLADDTPFRDDLVRQLRTSLARYPADPAVVDLVADLLAGSDDFARRWERHDVEAEPQLRKTFHHPRVGPVTLDCDTLELTGSDQRLTLYSAAPGSADADALTRLEAATG